MKLMSKTSNSGNSKTLYKYDTSSNKFVWFTTWDRALRNFYTDDPAYIPDPVTGNAFNTNVRFYSRKPGMVNVDWGDGVKEQFPMTKIKGQNEYRIIFRSLDVEWNKNPSGTWWFRKEDGSQYVPVPNHVYADGRKDVQRTISIDFTCDIYYVCIDICKMTSFPVVDLPGVEFLTVSHTMYVNDGIPFEKLSRATKLTEVILSNVGKRMSKIPEAITSKENITHLDMFNMLDLGDIEASGIRSIKNMKNLKKLYIGSCYLPKYIKEFNELPFLNLLDISPGPSDMWNRMDVNVHPKFDEVDKINPSIKVYNVHSWKEGERRTGWNEESMAGKGWEYIEEFNVDHSSRLDVDNLPTYFKEMRSLKKFIFNNCTHTQQRADKFVDSFYALVTGWENLTMTQTASDGKRNQFYGLSIWMHNNTYPNENQRPSGVEQAPEGFVKGQSNGTPSTPMEKIYVLKNNYGQKWSIKPA